MGKYSVSLYMNEVEKLQNVLEPISDNFYYLSDGAFYDDYTGINIDFELSLLIK